MNFTLLLSLLLLFLSVVVAGTTSVPALGVTYRFSSDHQLPPPDAVAATLHRLKISTIRLPPGTDPTIIRSFTYSNVSLLLTVPNSLIPSLAGNRSNAAAWLYRHVIPFYPRAKITTISVGNDPLNTPSDLSDYLLPAIRNVHVALHELGIRSISVSTTFSFINVLTTAFPPSAAEFQEPANQVVIKPFLEFLEEANSSFLINLYPYNLYRLNSEIPIGFALFQEHPFNFRDDYTTGVRYRNLFDTMVDAVITSMAVAGHENIPLVVTETGWPSAGAEAGEIDANHLYAEMYLKGLTDHLRSGLGTPLRKEGVSGVYVYELFDRQRSQNLGSLNVQQWGILYPNMTQKYKVDFSGTSRVGFNVLAVVISWLLVFYLCKLNMVIWWW